MGRPRSALKILLALSVAAVFVPAPVRGAGATKLDVPYLSSPVLDEVHLLDDASSRAVDQALRSLHDRGVVQMVVYIPKSLQDLPIEEFSIRVAEAWKLGRKGQDKGLLLVIAPNERKMRLEVGYGLEGDLTDAFSKHVTDDILRPYFRDKNYGAGVLSAVGAVAAKLGSSIEDGATGQVPAPDTTGQEGDLSMLSALLIPFLPFLFLALLVWSIRNRWVRRTWRYSRRRGPWDDWGGGGGGWGGFGGGGLGGGGGGFSGGGGGFGGGGASSSW